MRNSLTTLNFQYKTKNRTNKWVHGAFSVHVFNEGAQLIIKKKINIKGAFQRLMTIFRKFLK